MATTPQAQPPAKPAPPANSKPASAHEALPIGAKPSDPKDPQAAKFEAHAAPPRWEEPKAHKPENVSPDGPTVVDEQRARSAEFEKEGFEKWIEAADQRPADERPKFAKAALAIGGAFIAGAAAQKQVQGVAPPVKKE